MPATFTGVQVSQLDDNMIPGATYTFQFKPSSWLSWSPSNDTVAGELEANAPSFISSSQVSAPSGLSGSLYNIQFTYSGDGSDVISDVAASIIAAIKAGGSTDFTFIGATQSPASAVVVNLANTAAVVEQKVSDAVTKVGTDVAGAAGAAVKKVSDDTFSALVPWLIGGAVLILVLLPAISKAGLIPKVTTG